MAESDKPLQLYEAGHYSELTGRPNPAGYVILNVPDFDALVQLIEQKRGRTLAPEEIEAKRQEAPCIVLLKEEAAKMIASRISSRGH